MFAIAHEYPSPIQEVAPPVSTQYQSLPEIGTKDAGEAPETDCVATDEMLVDRSRSGDKLAFGELIQRHRNACLKRARLMIRDRNDAEDEVQNAFWKAFQRLDQYRGEGSFGAWLSR